MLEEPPNYGVHRKHEMFKNVKETINIRGYLLSPCIGGPNHPTSSSVCLANIRLDLNIESTSSDVVFYMVWLWEHGNPCFWSHILWQLRNTELASCKYIWFCHWILVGFEQVSLAWNQRQFYPEASVHNNVIEHWGVPDMWEYLSSSIPGTHVTS